MKTRWLVTSLLVSSLLIPSLFLVPVLRAQDDIKFFPLSEVRPGLKGVGRTIFQGDTITEFQVEILGVLRNAIAPKQDLILARLSGGPLADTGVIAGMSGSPVYIDGKLVGAVAIAFPFSKEPIAGITPIEQMIDVVPQAKTAADGHLKASEAIEATRAAAGDPGASLSARAFASLGASQGFKIVDSPGGPRLIPDPAETGATPAW